MQRLIRVVDRILHIGSLALLACMTVSVIVSVFLRYLLGITFVWAEEVITMLFVSTTFFGGTLAVREKEHIGITSFLTVLPKRAENILVVLGLGIVAAVQIFVIETSIEWIGQVGSRLTAGLRIEIRYFYYMIPVSAALILIYVFWSAFAILFRHRRNDEQLAE